MRRRVIVTALGGGLALLGVLAVVLGWPGTGSAFFANAGGGADVAGAEVRLDQRPAGAVVLQTPVYRLTISKRDGAFIELVEVGTGQRLITGTGGCEWGISSVGDSAYMGGCVFTPTGSSRFSYAWDSGSSTLTLTYAAGADAEQHVDAVVTLHAEPTFFDMRLQLTNHAPQVVESVNFPVDLFGDANTVRAGYAPNFLPGVRFGPAFFQRAGNDVFTYPGRWAFADYLALDVDARRTWRCTRSTPHPRRSRRSTSALSTTTRPHRAPGRRSA